MSSAAQNSSEMTGTKTGSGKRMLGARISLAVLGLIMALIAAWGLTNITAISTYNQATRSLNTSIAEANRADADPAKIKAIQDQTDQLFHQAESMGPLLLPETRQTIQRSRAVSDRLTRRVTRQVRSQEASKGGEGRFAGSPGQSGTGQQGQQGLTKDQQEKVDEILKQSQQAHNPSTGTQTDQAGEDQKTVKPW